MASKIEESLKYNIETTDDICLRIECIKIEIVYFRRSNHQSIEILLHSFVSILYLVVFLYHLTKDETAYSKNFVCRLAFSIFSVAIFSFLIYLFFC